MKLLVFAHIPPPHHGQSYMVKLMLDGFGGDARKRDKSAIRNPQSAIECYHVNAQVSDNMEDIGTFRLGKILSLLRYCIEAIWCRFRYGVRTFYYVPAPGKRAALYRDWIVMLMCRPFFRERIYHWHASGLGDWLKREGNWFERWLTHRLLGKPKLGLSLAIPSMRDALWFRSGSVEIVANGIPDPCPDFDKAIRPHRQARASARRRLMAGETLTVSESENAGAEPEVFRVLYLAHCTREKGVFDTIEGVRIANERLRAQGLKMRVHATLAGAFLFTEEESELKAAIEKANAAGHCITHAGFVSGETKQRLLIESDCLCFPTYYNAEGQPVSLLEAMAYGLQIITTRWRAIPEMLPADHPGFCTPRDPADVASKLIAVCAQDALPLRDHFLANYTARQYVTMLDTALRSTSC